jgi:hypothetical protein
MSRFGVSPAPALHLLATAHRSELRLTRLALFTVTHLHKLSIASAIQPQFNPSILPAHAPLQSNTTCTLRGTSPDALKALRQIASVNTSKNASLKAGTKPSLLM